MAADLDLLSQCRNAGLDVCRSCRNGNCERCFCELVAGQVTSRNGAIIQAPATIALCTSYAARSVTLTGLPINSPPQHWSCQWLGPQTLLLPAGKQAPPQPGEPLALLQPDHTTLLTVSRIDGRRLQIDRRVGERGGYLLRIAPGHEGPCSLLRELDNAITTVWEGISPPQAAHCQRLARDANWPGRYFWH